MVNLERIKHICQHYRECSKCPFYEPYWVKTCYIEKVFTMSPEYWSDDIFEEIEDRMEGD